MVSRVARAALGLTMLGVAPACAQSDPGEVAFVEWARGSMSRLESLSPGGDDADLESLGRMIGDASVVALTDIAHMGAEATLFRNRVFQYLVENKGFRAIAVESGLLEGRAAHDWVRGGAGTLEQVVARSFSYGFHEDPQNAELLRWLRAYDDRVAAGDRVNYYGFDVSGRGNFAEGVRYPLEQALAYLDVVDAASAASFRDRLSEFLPRLTGPFEGGSYSELTPAERDALTATIADLLNRIREHEHVYTAASSSGDYRWAVRAAFGAWQMDELQRNEGFALDDAARERIQADNLKWILEQEASRGKLLVYAALPHLSAAPRRGGITERRFGMQYTAGTYLRSWLGRDLVVIGGLVGNGIRTGCGSGREITLPPAPDHTLAGIARRVAGQRPFLLDIRRDKPDSLNCPAPQ